MKKLISCILAILMLCSCMVVSTVADDPEIPAVPAVTELDVSVDGIRANVYADGTSPYAYTASDYYTLTGNVEAYGKDSLTKLVPKNNSSLSYATIISFYRDTEGTELKNLSIGENNAKYFTMTFYYKVNDVNAANKTFHIAPTELGTNHMHRYSFTVTADCFNRWTTLVWDFTNNKMYTDLGTEIAVVQDYFSDSPVHTYNTIGSFWLMPFGKQKENTAAAAQNGAEIYIADAAFVTEENLPDVVAYQTGTNEGATAIRFVMGLDTLSYDSYGFKVTAKYTEAGAAKQKLFDLNSTTAYTSLSGLGGPYDPTEDPYNTNYFGAISISGLPESEITFYVTPYVVVDGQTLYGITEMLAYPNAN